ncbi:centrosomal protein of 44 kDa isoform X2 [Tachysurus ichikawai]
MSKGRHLSAEMFLNLLLTQSVCRRAGCKQWRPVCSSVCVCRLEQQLSKLDTRVQALEKSTAEKICIEHSASEKLDNWVLLLTRAQGPMRTGGVMSVERSPHNDESVMERVKEHQTSPANQISSSSEENIKERLERIASMMKDTSSLLKSIESSIQV